MYRSPFNVATKCTCAYKKPGSWSAGYHTGEDYVPKNGAPTAAIVSPAAGTVLKNQFDSSYGYYVVIRTTDNKVILMAHLKAKSTLAVGASIKAGASVGNMGSTGKSTGPHLHIEVQNATTWTYNKNLLKPSDYINFSDYSGTAASSGVSKLTGVPYKNGSTIEKTYATVAAALAGKSDNIGNLETYESCTCYSKVGSAYAVVYDTKSSGKKAGFAKFAGGAYSAPTSGLTYQNGSTKELTYSTIADVNAKKNSIGYLDPWESAMCIGKVDGHYLVVYDTSIGNTKKIGFVAFAGGVK